MALDGSFESKLLRVLIGYMHVSVLQQLALTQYGKAFHLLNQEEKSVMESITLDPPPVIAGLQPLISHLCVRIPVRKMGS